MDSRLAVIVAACGVSLSPRPDTATRLSLVDPAAQQLRSREAATHLCVQRNELASHPVHLLHTGSPATSLSACEPNLSPLSPARISSVLLLL